jgi:cytochrome c oxidase cbb3-type subunit 4
MTYEEVASISGTIGLVFFMTMFAVVLAYALWPGNKSKFDQASRAPLDEE